MVASQMADAVYDQTTVDIEAQPKDGNERYLFRATRSVLRFPGYRQLYQDTADEGEETEEKRPLPALVGRRGAAAAGPPAGAALHRAAAALHGGDAGEGDGGERHRAAEHLRARSFRRSRTAATSREKAARSSRRTWASSSTTC